MSHADILSSRDRWQSKLDVYRAALASTLTQSASETYTEQTAHEANGDEPPSQLDQNLLDGETDLPVEGIVKQIRRHKPYLLGLGTLGVVASEALAEVVSTFADRLVQRTARKTLVIQIRDHQKVVPDPSGWPVACSEHFQATWNIYRDDKVARQQWYGQLAQLTHWRQQFGLILLDLGAPDSTDFARLGRLCHGLVLQLHQSAAGRPVIQSIKRLQSSQSKVLGVWSISA
jgi:hypothetical protein